MRISDWSSDVCSSDLRSIATTGRLGALFDFENKKVFFPDIHASFKFCALVFGGPSRRFKSARCAFFLHAVAELAPPVLPEDAGASDSLRATRVIELGADDFAAVNPNTRSEEHTSESQS